MLKRLLCAVLVVGASSSYALESLTTDETPNIKLNPQDQVLFNPQDQVLFNPQDQVLFKEIKSKYNKDVLPENISNFRKTQQEFFKLPTDENSIPTKNALEKEVKKLFPYITSPSPQARLSEQLSSLCTTHPSKFIKKYENGTYVELSNITKKLYPTTFQNVLQVPSVPFLISLLFPNKTGICSLCTTGMFGKLIIDTIINESTINESNESTINESNESTINESTVTIDKTFMNAMPSHLRVIEFYEEGSNNQLTINTPINHLLFKIPNKVSIKDAARFTGVGFKINPEVTLESTENIWSSIRQQNEKIRWWHVPSIHPSVQIEVLRHLALLGIAWITLVFSNLVPVTRIAGGFIYLLSCYSYMLLKFNKTNALYVDDSNAKLYNSYGYHGSKEKNLANIESWNEVQSELQKQTNQE